jgi:hypothetical protein|tara:strand:- start:1 stop:354 length:354 start_codon:yes stop_codon:yes gene_type:complete
MTTKVHSYLGGLNMDVTNKFEITANATVTVGNGTSTGNVHVGGEVAATTFIGDGSALTGIIAGIGFFNSSLSAVPGTTSTDMGDLTSGTDAFGINNTPQYDCLDPTGQLLTTDLGTL